MRPRPCRSPYAADNSTGSNLGPTSKALIDRVKGDTDTLERAERTAAGSGRSGDDLGQRSRPDITPAGAEFQIARVAKARGMARTRPVRDLVQRSTEGRTFGVLGEPHVNVLKLNLALDAASAAK